MDRNRGGRPRHPDVLTPAEWRVLEALRDGGTNAEIGARLGLSLDTVKYHISNMLAKLELRDRRALAAWRPDAQRGRLGAVLAVPAVLWAVVGRPLVWVGVGVAALAGVAVVVAALVALEAVVERDSDAPAAVAPPPATATPTPAVAPTATPSVFAAGPALAPSATPPAAPSPTPAGTPEPRASRTPAAPAPAPGSCATPTDPTCIHAVYRGAPADHAQVPDIPADALLTPASDGRYYVGRGQQVTVVTAAPLPAGWTRFWLDRSPLKVGVPSPTSFEQLVQPVGTTYTFTVTDDEAGATLITFDLTAARPHPVRPTHKPVLGDVVVTTEFAVPKLRYNLLDTAGAAATPGSYAFLQAAGDVSSAIENFGLRPAKGVELRIHPTDASGVSRAALYDTLKVGDAFEYRTNGLDCSFRFRVTSVSTPASVPRSYGLHFVSEDGGRCGDAIDDPAAAKDVDFAWLVPPGRVGADGIRELIPWEPAGNGTYRIGSGGRYVIDVPLGMRIVASPEFSTYGSSITSAVTLTDEETGARLQIDPATGEVLGRDASTRLDPIVDSIRLAD